GPGAPRRAPARAARARPAARRRPAPCGAPGGARRTPSCRPTGLVRAELQEVLGHGPAEGDEAVPCAGAQAGEHGDHVRVDRLRLQRLVIEVRCEVTAAADPERLLVIGALDGEALGQAAAPRPLLAHRLVAGTGHDVRQGPERLEP